MRKCAKCHISKTLEEFHAARHCREGRKYICKSCVRAWGVDYREKNAETIKAKKSAYRESPHGRAVFNAYKTRWLQKPEKRRQHMKAIGERVKVRRRTEPAFRLKKMRLARDHYLKRYGSRVALAALFDSQLGRCANPYCGVSLKAGCHVDHIMPVALGGNNDLRNLQFLCPDLQLSKKQAAS